MEMFIEIIEDPHIQGMAEESIRGQGAFRRFKNFIGKYPDLQKHWYTWKEERTHLRAEEWLDENGLVLIKNF
jgi:hypothetical protein